MSAPISTSRFPDAGVRVSDAPASYRPNKSRHAQKLIARIQKNARDTDAIQELASYYEQQGDQASLVNLMEGWGDTLEQPRRAADAYLRAADAALVGLSDRARAKTLYERALSRDASHVEALDRVSRLLEDRADHGRLKDVLKYVAFHLTDRAEHKLYFAQVQYRLGQVYELRLDEPGKAVKAYRSAIEANPKLMPAIAAMRSIYAQVGNTHAMAALYELEIEATPTPDDKHGLLLALARLKLGEDDLDGAILVLRRTLKLAPTHTEALLLLTNSLIRRADGSEGDSRDVDRRRAAEVLYQVARAVPRAEAAPYLEHALELHPEHEKVALLLRELGGYGGASTGVGPSNEPQLTLDGRDTLRTTIAAIEDLAGSPHQSNPLAQDAPTPPAPIEPPRNSAEVWLDEHDFANAQELNTSELLPIEDDGPLHRTPRPSTLPPSSLAEQSLQQTFPPRELLRAPRIPDLGSDAPSSAAASRPATRASSRPAPPPRISLPPPAPLGRRTPRRSAQPSAGSANAARPSTAAGFDERRDHTLVAWHLPDPEIAPPAEAAARDSSHPPAESGLQPLAAALALEEVGAAALRARVLRGELPFEPERTSLEVNVGVTTVSNFYVGFDNSIRGGGVFVETYTPLPLNTLVDVLLTLPGELSARVHGHVQLTRTAIDPFSDEVAGMCIAFDALDEDALALCERFIEKRAPMFIDE